MTQQIRYMLAIWLMASMLVVVSAQNESQVYTFESGIQFTIPAEGVVDDSGAFPVINYAEIALIDMIEPAVLGQTPDATLNMPLADILDFLLSAVGYKEARIDNQTISLTLLDGRESLGYEFTNGTVVYQLIIVIRLSDGRVGALNIRASETLSQTQITAIIALANSFDLPAENAPTFSDAEAALVAGLTQEFAYESGTNFRFQEEFVIVGIDSPPVTIGIDEVLIMTMVDPQMVRIPAGESMEEIIEFAIGSKAFTPDDFEPFDIGGRESTIAVVASEDFYIGMVLVRFADETFGIMDILIVDEPTDEQINMIRRVAASFNSASAEVGITGADIDEAKALFEEAMATRDEGDNEAAIDLFTQALDLNPDLALAHYWRAASYQQMGRLEDAIVGYQITLELAPDQVQIHIDISDLYALIGDVDTAIAELELYLDKIGDGAIDPEVNIALPIYQMIANGEYNEDYYYSRAIRLHSYGLDDQALESNQITIDNDPNNAELYNQRGVIYIDIERYPEAIDAFTDGLNVELRPILFYHRGYANRENALNDLSAMVNGVHDYQCFLLLADDSASEERIEIAERGIMMTFISSDDYEPITDPADCLP